MSDNISITFNDEFHAFIAAMKKAPVEVGDQAAIAVSRTALETSDKLQAAAPKAFSTLVNSIKPDMISRYEWRVGPHVDYAEDVENGTKPGYFPNLESLGLWARTKLKISDKKESLRVAEKIMWSIHAKGTKAHPFVKPVVDSGWPQQRLNQLANKAVKTGLKKAGL